MLNPYYIGVYYQCKAFNIQQDMKINYTIRTIVEGQEYTDNLKQVENNDNDGIADEFLEKKKEVS